MSTFPAKHKLQIWKGTTFHYKFTYLEGNPGSNPKNLAGHTAKFIVKDKPNGTTLLTLNAANYGVQINPLDGTIALYISANPATIPNTSNITWKSGVYELLISNSDNSRVDSILYGPISVTSY